MNAVLPFLLAVMSLMEPLLPSVEALVPFIMQKMLMLSPRGMQGSHKPVKLEIVLDEDYDQVVGDRDMQNLFRDQV